MKWAGAIRLLLQGLLPVVLLLTSVSILLSDTFLRVEYRLPGFPPDSFGFTTEDRLRWAPVALEYLLNDAGIEFLADLRFDSGAPVYTSRELSHMQDVKDLTQAALRVWAGGLAAVLLAAVALQRLDRPRAAVEGFMVGARFTLILMGVLGGGLIVAFSVVFIGFHRVFFEGNTWLFVYSDTLIRLFPERFWRDAFLFLAFATLLQAGLVYWGARRWLARRPDR
jgi:integral membrane protein (TIGR01906 family)